MRRSRRRCWLVSLASAGTRRPLMARQRRATASIRSSPLAPSDTRATSGLAGEASDTSRSRAVLDPRPWTMLNPSGLARAVLRSYSGRTMLSTGSVAGTVVRMSVPGSMSGTQNTVAAVASSVGSIAKAQPPAPPDRLGKALGRVGGARAFGKIPLIDSVAPQAFPGKVWREELIQVVVGVGRAPARCVGTHMFPPAAAVRGAFEGGIRLRVESAAGSRGSCKA